MACAPWPGALHHSAPLAASGLFHKYCAPHCPDKETSVVVWCSFSKTSWEYWEWAVRTRKLKDQSEHCQFGSFTSSCNCSVSVKSISDKRAKHRHPTKWNDPRNCGHVHENERLRVSGCPVFRASRAVILWVSRCYFALVSRGEPTRPLINIS